MMVGRPPHVPVLLAPIIDAVAPVSGIWLDGTFGAGGYARALIEAGAERVVAIDRDPAALAAARAWSPAYGERLTLVEGRFGELDTIAARQGAHALSGVVLDIGVSSMQIDDAARGFSFQRDGPLDMRMGGGGRTASELVNRLSEAELADILFQYGEERASRRIARAVVAARPLASTLQLAEVIAGCLPLQKPGQPHPATRSFQALRIAVNDEMGELVRGLAASERALAPGGWLAVVTFHSLEDRVVKRFLQQRAGAGPGASRHAPAAPHAAPRFSLVGRRPIVPGEAERAANPRARSARLRLARRTEAAAEPIDPSGLGLPGLALRGFDTGEGG